MLACLDRVMTRPTWWVNLWRTLLVLFTAGVAMAIPHFGDFIAVVGSMGSTMLAFVFPALFHLKLCGPRTSRLKVCLSSSHLHLVLHLAVVTH